MLGKRPVNYSKLSRTSSVAQPAILHTNEVVLPVAVAKELHRFLLGRGQVMSLELKRKIANLYKFSPA